MSTYKKKKDLPEHLRKSRQFTDDDAQEMAILYERGYSLREIGQLFQCSHSTIAGYLREQGADLRRDQTANANAARAAIFKERLLTKAFTLLDRSDDLEHRMMDTYEQIVTGPQGAELITLKEPPLREQSDAARAAVALATTAGDLFEKATVDNDQSKGVAVLDRIVSGLNDLFGAEPEDAGLDDGDFDPDYDIRLDPDEKPGLEGEGV